MRPARTLGRAQDFTLQRRIAAGLGCFSIGLGLFELLAPRTLGRLIGLKRRQPGQALSRWARYADERLNPRLIDADTVHALVIRGVGVRQIASGFGILTRPRPAAWLWSRVAGDVMDLSLLGLALSGRRKGRARLIGATAAVLAVTALDVFASLEYTRVRRAGQSVERQRRRVPLEATVLVNRPPEECYRFWHDLTNLPRFMRTIESVRVENAARSHWVAREPGDVELEWDSEIIQDIPDRLISWRSVDPAIPYAGTVHFDPVPGGRATLVRVRMNHGGAPGGALSRATARLLGKVPEVQIREDLRRFKRILETEEIPPTRGKSHGRLSRVARTLGRGIGARSHVEHVVRIKREGAEAE